MLCLQIPGTRRTAQLGTPSNTDAWAKANCTRPSRTSNLVDRSATIVAKGLRDVLGSRCSRRTACSMQHAAHTQTEEEARETRLLSS